MEIGDWVRVRATGEISLVLDIVPCDLLAEAWEAVLIWAPSRGCLMRFSNEIEVLATC